MLAIDVAGTTLVLLPQRAAYIPATRTLLVADAHFGKAHSFRRLGVPVPSGTTAQNLQRLSQALALTGATELIFLGDLLHAARGVSAELVFALEAWKREHAALRWTLVRGNHDQHAGDPPPELAMRVVNEPLSHGAFALCHHPQAVPGAYALAGHMHPGVSLGRVARLRLPCFWFGAQQGVLPAFGDFTGTASIRRAAADRVFVVTEQAVLALP